MSQNLGQWLNLFWARYTDVKMKTGEHLVQKKKITRNRIAVVNMETWVFVGRTKTEEKYCTALCH